jgi:hypothetical protein
MKNESKYCHRHRYTSAVDTKFTTREAFISLSSLRSRLEVHWCLYLTHGIVSHLYSYPFPHPQPCLSATWSL